LCTSPERQHVYIPLCVHRMCDISPTFSVEDRAKCPVVPESWLYPLPYRNVGEWSYILQFGHVGNSIFCAVHCYPGFSATSHTSSNLCQVTGYVFNSFILGSYNNFFQTSSNKTYFADFRWLVKSIIIINLPVL